MIVAERRFLIFSMAFQKINEKICKKNLKHLLRIVDQDKNDYGKHRKQRS